MSSRPLLALPLLVTLACGGDQSGPAPHPSPTAQPTATTPPAPEPTATTPPTATAPPTATVPEPPPPPTDPTVALTQLGQVHTAGMKSEGSVITAQLAAGGQHDHAFVLQPGKCYTVVAAALGVTELEARLVSNQPPIPETPVAQGKSSGGNAVIGGDGQCFTNPLPIAGPVKLRLQAKSGSGPVAAQIFVK